MKAGFVGFGEVNTPTEIIVRKCAAAAEALKQEGVSLVSVYPVTDDYAEKDIGKALSVNAESAFFADTFCSIYAHPPCIPPSRRGRGDNENLPREKGDDQYFPRGRKYGINLPREARYAPLTLVIRGDVRRTESGEISRAGGAPAWQTAVPPLMPKA